MDRRGSDPSDSSRESTSALHGLFCVCCVVDIFRYLHPSTPGFTWTKWNGALACFSAAPCFVLFFAHVPPLGWLGAFIIVLFFVLRGTPWLARGYDYCFVFCLRMI